MQEEKYEEQGISLNDLFFLVKKNLVLILIVTIGCTILGAIYGFFIKETTYSATTTAIVNVDKDEAGSSSAEYSIYSYCVLLANNYSVFIKTQPVLDDVVNDLKNEYPDLTQKAVKECITVSIESSTTIILVTAKTNDSAKSIAIANAVVASTIQVANASGAESLANKLFIIDGASETTATRGAAIVCVVSLLIGLVISFAIVLIKYLADDTYTSKDAFEKAFNINILACLQDAEGSE